MVFVPSPGSTGPFTGRGFISLVSFSSVQFIFTAPKSDEYELIIRFEVFITFNYVRSYVYRECFDFPGIISGGKYFIFTD